MYKIDSQSRIPVYEQLEALIIKYTTLGVLSADDKLPSVRAMAQELGVNPNTVQKAYKLLEIKDVIYTVGGKGVFVKGQPYQVNVAQEDKRQQLIKSIEEAKSVGITSVEMKLIIEDIFKGECLR